MQRPKRECVAGPCTSGRHYKAFRNRDLITPHAVGCPGHKPVDVHDHIHDHVHDDVDDHDQVEDEGW